MLPLPPVGALGTAGRTIHFSKHLDYVYSFQEDVRGPISESACLTPRMMDSAASRRTNGEPVLQFAERFTIAQLRRASFRVPDSIGESRMHVHGSPTVGKIRAVAGVEICLRRQTLSDDRIMRRQLDMPIGGGCAGHLCDSRSVQQMPYWDQHLRAFIAKQHCVFRAKP